MILGMTRKAFTLFHVILSLIGIFTGLVALFAMLGEGFLIPVVGLDPPRIIGILALVVLLIALTALYVGRLEGSWRLVCVGPAVLALYLNVFVAVVQSFMKLSFPQPLAPTQSEPPFLVTQLVVLVLFVVLGILAARRFHPAVRLAR